MTPSPTTAAVTAQSLQLRQAAAAACHERLLPALREQLPEVADRILVTVTSSAAYGTADEHSDLDMFVILPRHADYLQYAAQLEKIIDGLDLATAYGSLCDKGMRFELESLQRSDLSGVYYRPQHEQTWLRQTEWLLCWLRESIPVYDPAGVHARFLARAGTWPEPVAKARELSARTRIETWAAVTSREARANGLTFTALRAAMRVATAGLDLAYLAARRYGPHPKWRSPMAHHLLDDPRAAAILAPFDTLAAVLAADDCTAPAVCGAVDRFAHAVRRDDLEVADWANVLPYYADRVIVPSGRYWLATAPTSDPVLYAAARAATLAGEHVYLAEELGTHHLRAHSYTYDKALRIADEVRWSSKHGRSELDVATGKLHDSGSIASRRWRYLNFVIWRKLRVVDKASRRGQWFTCRWYQLQVLDHLSQALARLAGDFTPPPHLHTHLPPAWAANQLQVTADPQALAALLADVPAFLQWGWRQLGRIQHQLLADGRIPASAIDDPLTTQWDVQYWKYENLFV